MNLGESLPVNKLEGEEVFSGSVIKQGETNAVIYAIGANTFFGRAATLVEETENTVRFRK